MSAQQVLVPVFKEVMGDLDTPVSAYLKLDHANSFLLESVVNGENVARYSFIGFDPLYTVTAKGKTVSIRDSEGVKKVTGDPIAAIESLVARYRIQDVPSLPPFIGGAVGYFSWEAIQHIEKIRIKKKPGRDLPSVHFMIPGSLMIFDHAQRKIIIVVLAKKGSESAALLKVDEIKAILARRVYLPIFDCFEPPVDEVVREVVSNVGKSGYIDAVKRVKHYIREGDIFQLVLSQKFRMASEKKPFDTYRSLRMINPSPYMYYFNFGTYQIIGSSPEILTRLQNGVATLRPIAGTRPRPSAEDEPAVIAGLLQDEKERSEHIMLVDLGRNDLGRVCEYNSVHTDNLMAIERYSHVLHMVSNVTGKLKAGKNAFDLFRATFPAGTVSGAPKVRAIELIESLEPERRGIYAGALGYFDFRGNMDLCLVIRTLIHARKQYEIQAGAGIVADSDPEMEYKESLNKALGMLKACYKRKGVYASRHR